MKDWIFWGVVLLAGSGWEARRNSRPSRTIKLASFVLGGMEEEEEERMASRMASSVNDFSVVIGGSWARPGLFVCLDERDEERPSMYVMRRLVRFVERLMPYIKQSTFKYVDSPVLVVCHA
jgi:hypothetical protein